LKNQTRVVHIVDQSEFSDEKKQIDNLENDLEKSIKHQNKKQDNLDTSVELEQHQVEIVNQSQQRMSVKGFSS
jgi:hypothetical protein